jgi:DNA-binding transcriptional LysR family regulator
MLAPRVGDVDVIITTTDFVEQPLGPDLDIVPLATDPITLVMPPGHPAAGRGPPGLAAFADEPWAFDLPQSYMANLATRLCREAGFEPRVVCRFSNYMLTMQHVEAGLSIALLPGLAVDPRYRAATCGLAAPVTRTIRRRSAAAHGGGQRRPRRPTPHPELTPPALPGG